VVLSLNPGGTERLLVELVKRLRESMDMAVCCLDEPGTWGRQLEAENIPVTVLQRRPGFHPSLGRLVAAAAQRHRATAIHAHQYTPFVYASLSRLWSRQAPLIFTEHGRLSDAPASGKRRLANGILRRAPARVFAVSEDLRQFMIAEGFRAEQVDVLYNGIDVSGLSSAKDREDVRAALGFGADAWIIGTIARLDPVKELGTLLRAIALPRAGRPLGAVIVGDGPERARLEALAAELNVTSRVRFVGHREDARRWLAGCDVYVNSSASEGVSLTILEAMAAALPIVATRVGGTPEVVTAECGVLVPARDPAALAQAIDATAAAPDEAKARGVAGRKRVEARFTIDRMVQDYAAVYARVSQ
jgi:glycosyltransferase involved in cell wall biosynthesis